VRVLLADDHTLLLEGLQNLLEAHGLEVVGLAKNGREAAEKAREHRPDLVLMDVRMPEWNGLTATRVIKSEMPEIKVVMLTTSTEDGDLFEAVKSGANGYLLKSMDAESLLEALRDAEDDIPPFAPGLAAKLLAEFSRAAEPAVGDAEAVRGEEERLDGAPEPGASGGDTESEALTARQAEVLALVAQGLSYKQVGTKVCLSARTVKYHMAEIMRKLHLENRAQVLAYAGRMSAEGGVPAGD